jgi:hypothetical protein
LQTPAHQCPAAPEKAGIYNPSQKRLSMIAQRTSACGLKGDIRTCGGSGFCGSHVNGLWLVVVIKKNSLRRAVQVLVLSGMERPQKRNKSDETHKDRQGDKDGEIVHRSVSATAFGENNGKERSREADGLGFRSRIAFATTSTEDSDIAIAAKSGVT